MGNASFLQSSFLGGVWSPNIQGNMRNEAYKNALNVSVNYYPVEEGAITRRPGTRFLSITRKGQPGRLITFDFSIIQPYELEFTAGYMRMFAGLAPVTSDSIAIETITTDNPAVVLTSAPHGFSTGQTVVFSMAVRQPCQAPLLAKRQFQITVIDALTFSIQDSITNANIDGSTLNYVDYGDGADKVQSIFELTTLYSDPTLFDNLRSITTDKAVVILDGVHIPQVLTEVNPGPFGFSNIIFNDGPYLDINGTTNRVTPSGLSGSITLTWDNTLNINNGAGFQSSDVGRLVRIQGGPPVWGSGSTYAKNDTVTGSDSNTYQSLVDGNVGNDPTTDGGVHWELGTTGVTWTWAKITAVTNTTTVTATISGANLVNTDATPIWRLGVYSDTTGWPKVGVFHEGRLWLSGSVGNRIDGGTSNNVDVLTGQVLPTGTFNFAPTAPDGTVADANAVSATANAADVNAVLWMASDQSGLVLGTQAGEWIVRASQLDDPITPTSIQMRRFSTYGVAPIEPIRAQRELIFVQRQQRKVLELGYYPYGEVAGYYAPNMAKFAENLTAPGIAEIRWQQTQTPIVWLRRLDGALLGVTYKHAPASGMGTADTFTAWHGPHIFGHGRTLTSIATGPSWDGLSDSLYMISNQTNVSAPDYNIHWVEMLTPDFDDAVIDENSDFVDGGGSPTCVTVNSTLGTPVSVTYNGFWYLNGQTISFVLGTLDLGDFVVSNGSVTIPFTTDFTFAYFTGLDDSEKYGLFGVPASYNYTNTPPPAPPVAGNTLLGLVGADTNVVGSYNGENHLDPVNNKVYEINFNSGTKVAGIRRLEANLGAEEAQANEVGIFGNNPATTGTWNSGTTYALNDVATGSDGQTYRSLAGGNLNNNPVGGNNAFWNISGAKLMAATVSYYHPSGFIFAFTNGSNTSPISKISASTLAEVASFGTASSSFTGSSVGGLQLGFFSMAGPRVLNSDGSHTNYLSTVGIRSASVTNEVNLINTDSMTFVYAAQIDEAVASVTTGRSQLGHSNWFAIGKSKYSSHNNTPIGFYEYVIDSNVSVTRRKIGTLVPTDIDATWTNFSAVVGPAFDQSDGNLLFYVDTDDSVTNKHYLVKYNVAKGTVLWKITVPSNSFVFATDESMSIANINGRYGYFYTTDKNVYIINTADGSSFSITAFNAGLTDSGAQYWDQTSSSITLYCSYVQSGTPVPTYRGAYLAAHSDQLSSQWGRIFLGQLYSNEPLYHTYTVPTSMGFTYTSRGQLLRPDFGPDAGAQNGPAFGKKRRIHSASWSLYRTQQISAGTDFGSLEPLKLEADGGTLVNPPTLYTGIHWDTVNDDYGFTSQLAWEQTRPFPALIQAIEGYIATQDK